MESFGYKAQYEYGIPTPKFFSQEFKQIIDDYLVNTFGVYQRDITLLNAESNFSHLISLVHDYLYNDIFVQCLC